MTITVRTQAGYRATRQPDGTLVVHRVPIFVECERGEVQFGREWIAAAVAKAKQAETEGYLPPLHIRHHEPSTEATNAVRAAGFFRILGTEQITFKGSARLAVVADLIVTDPVTQQEILQKRLPYRSVEIFDVSKPALDSLALLDHEAPFLELPMLLVRDVDGSVPPGTLTLNPAPTVAACFRRGSSAHLLFRENEASMAEETKKGDDEKKGEGMGADGAGLNVDAIVKAIKDGSISVADFASIQAAMAEMQTETKDDEDKPAPAAAPGGESMKKNTADDSAVSARFAALQGELDGTKAKLAAFEADGKRKDDVAGAMKRLEGRPLGADIEATLIAFHKEHGGAAFKAYVDSLAKAVGVLPTDTGKGAQFGGVSGRKLPKVAMKYQDEGPEAVDRAAKIALEWEELDATGHVRMSQERYVQLNMAANPLLGA